MDHDMGTQVKRVLQIRSCERIVDAEQEIFFLCDGSNSGQIHDIHQWVCGRFYPDQFCFFVDESPDIFGILHIHVVKMDTCFFKYFIEEAEGSTIHIIGGITSSPGSRRRITASDAATPLLKESANQAFSIEASAVSRA